MFSGEYSKTFVYLNCCCNSGKSEGHAFHGRCLAKYLTTAITEDVGKNPRPYSCPVCK